MRHRQPLLLRLLAQAARSDGDGNGINKPSSMSPVGSSPRGEVGAAAEVCAVLQAFVKLSHICCVPRTGLCGTVPIPGGLWMSCRGPEAPKTVYRVMWMILQEA